MKKSNDWYISLTHFITSGIIILIMSLVLNMLLSFLPEKDIPIMASINPFAVSIIYIVGILLGTIYSANYISKTYIIKNPGKITLISTIYFIIYSVLTVSHSLFYRLIINILGIAIFYFISRKYIKETGETQKD